MPNLIPQELKDAFGELVVEYGLEEAEIENDRLSLYYICRFRYGKWVLRFRLAGEVLDCGDAPSKDVLRVAIVEIIEAKRARIGWILDIGRNEKGEDR